jgi:hypothetical protein
MAEMERRRCRSMGGVGPIEVEMDGEGGGGGGSDAMW